MQMEELREGIMSWPHKRSPFHSRSSNPHGRQGDGFFGEQYRSDPWRNPENVDKPEDSIHWDNSHSQDQDQVDHWAKFIEAIGRAGKRKSSPDSRFHAQEESPDRRRNEHHSRGSQSQEKRDGYHNEEHEDSSHERNSYTERLQKSDYRDHHLQPKRFRHLDPQEQYSESQSDFIPYHAPVVVEHDHGVSKRTTNRDHSRRQDLLQNQEQNRCPSMSRCPSQGRDPSVSRGPSRSRGPSVSRCHSRNRGPTMSRGLSRSRDPSMSRGLSQSRDPGMNRISSQSCSPNMTRGPSLSHDPYVNQGYSRNRDSDINQGHLRSQDPTMILEHSRNQDPVGSQENERSRTFPRSSDIMNPEHSRIRNLHRRNDLPRNNPKNHKPQMNRPLSRKREPLRNWEPLRHKGEPDHHAKMLHGRHDGPTHEEQGRRGSPMRGMSQHREHSSMDVCPRLHHGHTETKLNSLLDFRIDDLRTRVHDPDWDMQRQPERSRDDMREQGKSFRRDDQHGIPKNSGDRANFMEHETLKIKVDTSRPAGHSSHLGYSSDRQLSLDLVNVGRQRLDFLPMLEHSGTYKESAMHSGTFAQEIITLVHHVKEHYFQGQDITLNDRFSNEQSMSLVNEDDLDENEEMDDMGPVINRPFVSTSNAQIFCNVGPLQRSAEKAPAPGDLRFDLERKRLQKLEAVKITIAGNTQMLQPQERQSYVSEEDSFEAGGDSGWSEHVPQPPNKWDHPPQKRPGPKFNARCNVNRSRPGPRRRLNPKNNKGARW